MSRDCTDKKRTPAILSPAYGLLLFRLLTRCRRPPRPYNGSSWALCLPHPPMDSQTKVATTESPNEELPREATEDEIKNLVHEVDDIPFTAWLLTFTGAATHLARFSITVTWRKTSHSCHRSYNLLKTSRKLSPKSSRQSTAPWCIGVGTSDGNNHPECVSLLPVFNTGSIRNHIRCLDRPSSNYAS